MKRYKLKKDLPTFKTGDEFYINDNGNLMFDSKDCIVAYKASTLEKFPNILKDWFEEIKGRFYLADDGEIIKYNEDEDPYCLNYRKSIGNDFETEEEAQKHRDYLIALQTIKGDAKGFVPDWKDKDQRKYYGCYSYNINSLDPNWSYCFQYQGVIFFKTKEDLEESFNKHRKEWLTVLGVEEQYENTTR